MSFLDDLNGKVAKKRQSQQSLAKTLGQSPTKTESDWLHGVNITRFSAMKKHEPQRFELELRRRLAFKYANGTQRFEIMEAIDGEMA